MQDKNHNAQGSTGRHLLKVHLVGGLACAIIAGASIYFAMNSVSKRHGLFLSARHELANTKSILNASIEEHSRLTSQIKILEAQTANQVQLVSIKMLNSRTAEIVALAETVGIRIDSLQPGEKISDKRVPVQPLDFIGTAQADDVFAFLGLLGDQMPDIHIHAFEMVNDSPDTINVQVNMQMYWFVDPAGEM
ncbi:MAG: hypothetical protein JKX70_11255 [Phycisphaerales bacterium]|nr:hypothetical protein [Phycisphaerales bacterium]